ncbi:unnamed protein product [Gongylonema pulchrum]|uniref:CX domain-containing protein n=1 Tax=Gongylonema pulchrum TaxID=637853 RepID=A0A183E597_9BILA|nr:unnamed protein product [Gongylonema pulchrum]
MAQEPPSPWSRWDAPGYEYASNRPEPPSSVQYDSGFENSGPRNSGGPTRQRLVAGRLLEQRVNPNNPNFIECIYGAENSRTRYVEQCSKDTGCCETTCCTNRTWLVQKFCFYYMHF